jgi:thiol-disulfide isomerase/thioredoxin
MNKRILSLALAAAGLGAILSSHAAPPAPVPAPAAVPRPAPVAPPAPVSAPALGSASAPAPAPAAVVASEGEAEKAPAIITDLQALIGQIKAKMGTTGEKTDPSQLTAELGQFEALIAKHADAKSEDKASVLWMKAMLYLQVFEDFDQGAAVVRKIKAEYPGSTFGLKADEILGAIAKQKEAQAFQKTLVPGAVLPNFEGKTLDGQPISVLGFRDKYLLVDFWATWCGPCVGELPNVLAAYEKFHGKGFEVLAVSLDRSEEDLRKFVDEKKLPWAQIYEGAEAIAEKFGIESIPTTFLVDREGKIIARDLRGEDLAKKLEELLAEQK